jgi:hypothetical protein
MRRAWVGAVLVGLAMPAGAGAFGTIGEIGQSYEHEFITRASLACKGGAAAVGGSCFEPTSIDSLAGSFGTFGAVGYPDYPFSGLRTDPVAHCDDADHLDKPGYPQAAAKASAQLLACLHHLEGDFKAAVAAADGVTDPKGNLIAAQVGPGYCNPGREDRAKCQVILRFGEALHGAQDFYSHSNWSDEAAAGPITTHNPPGLNTGVLAPFLDFRIGSPSIAGFPDLTTGCYGPTTGSDQIGNDTIGACKGRILHHYLNKDTGTIDPVTGTATNPSTARGKVGSNFAKAVSGAELETLRQWDALRDALQDTYGATRANRTICALTHDDPKATCEGRRIALVIDSSGSNRETDPQGVRVAAATLVNDELTSNAEAATQPATAPDRSTVVAFTTGGVVLSPLGDPAAASFAGVGADGETDIGSGILTALSQLDVKDAKEGARAGIVVFTDGLDGEGSSTGGALAAAARLGVRVNVGLLAENPVPRVRAAAQPDAPAGLRGIGTSADEARQLQAFRATGGTVGVYATALEAKAFASTVTLNGLTGADAAQGADDGGRLLGAVAGVGEIAAGGDADTWATSAALRAFNVTLRPVGTAAPLRLAVQDLARGKVIGRASGPAGRAVRITVRSRRALKRRLAVTVSGKSRGAQTYTLQVRPLATRRVTGHRLVCSAASVDTRVVGSAGRDRIGCGAGDDDIVPGRGADSVTAGDGDDTVRVARGDVARGSELLDGGDGYDTLRLSFAQPAGVTCSSVASTPGPGRRLSLALSFGGARAFLGANNFEAILFRGKRCRARSIG